MTTRDLLGQAGAALVAHRLRATLSAVGIVCGVATVVAALAIGEGARREAIAEIGALGVENVLVRALPGEPPADRRRLPPAPALTLEDAQAIQATVAEVRSIGAVRSARVEVAANGRRRDGDLVGATMEWGAIAGVLPSRGRWLADVDLATRRRVAVLGSAVARDLFAGSDAVGREVRAGGTWHLVIGVLDQVGRPTARRQPIRRVDVNEAVIVPLGAMDVALGSGDAPDRVQEIAIRARGAAAVERVATAAAAALARRHPGAPSWEIVVPRALLEARLRAQRTFRAVLLAIGGLALAISGVGIMNIMLASVAERTHEIGVRRAFGARRREIVAQFALEAALLCLAGGVVGVPAGALLAVLAGLAGGWPIAISAASVLLALALAVGIGLSFGIYPARLAARLDPAAALREPL